MLNRKLMSYLGVFIMLAALLLSACGKTVEKSKLSDLNDEELINYITNYGAEIPHDVTIVTIRAMLEELEADPDHPEPVLGHTPIVELYRDIRSMVIKYNNGSSD